MRIVNIVIGVQHTATIAFGIRYGRESSTNTEIGMAHVDDGQKRVAAPYVAYQTVKTFIAPLKEHVIPNRIDKSLLRSFSGAVQNQLMTALKFLSLIEDDGRPTDVLKALVDAYGTDQWGGALKNTLKASYPELFDLPLASVSPSEFNEAFKKAYPCEGETLRKGVTFFLNAGRDAGIEFSPFLTKNAKPRSGPTKRRTKPANNKGEAPPAENVGGNGGSASGKTMAEQLLGKFPQFDPSWPDDLKAKWFEGYSQLLKMGGT